MTDPNDFFHAHSCQWQQKAITLQRKVEQERDALKLELMGEVPSSQRAHDAWRDRAIAAEARCERLTELLGQHGKLCPGMYGSTTWHDAVRAALAPEEDKP